MACFLPAPRAEVQAKLEGERLLHKGVVISPASRPCSGEGQTLRHRLEGDSSARHFDVDEEGGG